MRKPFLQLEERHGRSRVKELGRNGRTCSVAGDIATSVLCGHTAFLAQHRNQMVVNVELCYTLATIAKQKMSFLSSFRVDLGWLGRTNLFPCNNGCANNTIHRFGECRTGLAHGKVQETDRILRQNLLCPRNGQVL